MLVLVAPGHYGAELDIEPSSQIASWHINFVHFCVRSKSLEDDFCFELVCVFSLHLLSSESLGLFRLLFHLEMVFEKLLHPCFRSQMNSVAECHWWTSSHSYYYKSFFSKMVKLRSASYPNQFHCSSWHTCGGKRFKQFRSHRFQVHPKAMNVQKILCKLPKHCEICDQYRGKQNFISLP